MFGRICSVFKLRIGVVAAGGVAVLVSWILGAGAAMAHKADPDAGQTAALESSQAAVGRIVGDVRLRDMDGKPVYISAFRGRPLVVSLIYTSCAQTCPLLTQTLADIADVARDALGEDSFSLATIGFDVSVDTPERMRAFAREQSIGGPRWAVLSADAGGIDRLTHDLGFTYYRSAKGFDHLAQITILDADGRVYRQVYGETFDAPALVEPLKQLVFGTRSEFTSVEGLVNRVRLFCTIYDPSSGRYTIDYSLFIGMFIGAVSLAAVGSVLVRGWLRQRRLGRAA
jgi:protein SCO1/2